MKCLLISFLVTHVNLNLIRPFSLRLTCKFYDIDEIGCESDLTLMPKMISEAHTGLKQRNPTGIMGDENGVYLPNNLPYSPRKIT